MYIVKLSVSNFYIIIIIIILLKSLLECLSTVNDTILGLAKQASDHYL
jgi:hypothetical protein